MINGALLFCYISSLHPILTFVVTRHFFFAELDTFDSAKIFFAERC